MACRCAFAGEDRGTGYRDEGPCPECEDALAERELQAELDEADAARRAEAERLEALFVARGGLILDIKEVKGVE